MQLSSFQAFIEEYFLEDDMASEDASTAASAEVKEASIEDASRVRADVRAFVMTHADHAWSGRAVARVFHGIGDDDMMAFLFFWPSAIPTFSLSISFKIDKAPPTYLRNWLY